jgi:hypothetical protein
MYFTQNRRALDREPEGDLLTPEARRYGIVTAKSESDERATRWSNSHNFNVSAWKSAKRAVWK